MRFIKSILLVLALVVSSIGAAETVGMTAERLLESIKAYAEDVEAENNVISFGYQGISVFCVWDAAADRMRLISPIVELENVSAETLILAMHANYHTVLDARYAIGDGVVYSAFIHPLSSLSVAELESAIRQVATAAATFGGQYSSGELVFPGSEASEEAEPSGAAVINKI